MTDLVQAIRPFAGRVAGQHLLVRAGDLFAADDPAVEQFPDKFRAPVVRSTPAPRPPKATPAPEPNKAAMAEFKALKLTTEDDVVPLSEALAKLDEPTLAALMAEYEVSEDTPEAALVALAATRVEQPKEPKAEKPKASKPKAPAKRKATKAAPKKSSKSK